MALDSKTKCKQFMQTSTKILALCGSLNMLSGCHLLPSYSNCSPSASDQLFEVYKIDFHNDAKVLMVCDSPEKEKAQTDAIKYATENCNGKLKVHHVQSYNLPRSIKVEAATISFHHFRTVIYGNCNS